MNTATSLATDLNSQMLSAPDVGIAAGSSADPLIRVLLIEDNQEESTRTANPS